MDIVAHRLRNQQLARPAFRRPEEVVAWLGAVQSQDYTGAKWALNLRAKGLTDADVDRAYDEGRILRTHVMRPTWHFVAPPDLRWLLALTAPRVHKISAYYYKQNELDDRLFTRSRKALERALEGGATLTRAELAGVLARHGIEASGTRLAHIVFHAELEGVICSGPLRGKQFTYALLEERVPPAPSLTRDEALVELTRRYFTSHGPATLRDFAWWSGLTVRDAKAGVAMAGTTLLTHDDADLSYWHAPAARSATRPSSPSVWLLSNYDEFLIAHKDRGHVADRSVPAPPAPAGPAEYPHHLLIDGRLRGSWKRAIGPRDAVISVRPYRTLSTAERRAIAAEAERYGRFLGLPVTVSDG
jgi:hypothetical protein